MTFQKSTTHIVLITIITLIIATCIASIYFQDLNAQYYSNDNDNNIKLEPIRHMMDHRRHHMMMEDGQQQQESSMSNFSMTKSNKTTNADDSDNIIYVSIVRGAISRTTDAYQPNPIYLKESQMVVWTNNNYNRSFA